jgi:N utilization substance protein B
MDTKSVKHINKRRRAARELLMQLIYQMDAADDFSVVSGRAFLDEHAPDSASAKPDLKYFDLCLSVVAEHISEIDEAIQKASEHWKIRRISRVDLAILRLAAAEMLYPQAENPLPNKVSIDEAVEIAIKYAGEKSPAFVNGVLGKIAADAAY